MHEERIALITGCSSGLGLALASHCLDRGYHVIATARHPENIEIDHPRLHRRALDLAENQHIVEFARVLKDEFSHLDLLVNNAGYGLMGPLLDLPGSALSEQFQTNSIAPLMLVRENIGLLRASATVINIGSVSAHLTTPFAGSYCASKAALHSATAALRMELRPLGIRVLLVRAGAMRSRFGDRATAEWRAQASEGSRYATISAAIRKRAGLSQQYASDPQQVARQIVRAAEARRCPAEIAVASGSVLLKCLGLLPSWFTDALLMRQFQLHKLRRDLRQH